MDARDLSAFPEDTFDLVIDKLTLDTILCGEEADLNAAIMLYECQRVLKPDALYLYITHSNFEDR